MSNLAMQVENDAVPHGPDLCIQRNESQGNFSKDSICNVCWTHLRKKVYHRHFSAQYLNKNAVLSGISNMECPTCKLVHKTNSHNDRQLIIFGSSIIFEAYRSNLFRTPVHINFELVCGGKIRDFENLFKAQYAENSRPLDVFLCTGINDISGSHENEIIRDFESFYNAVLSSNVQNRCYVLRLIRPPSLYSFIVNEKRRKNSEAKINKVNEYLKSMNMKLNYPNLPNISHFGTYINPGMGIRHNLSKWRERSRGQAKCLHLVEDYRARICRKILQFIRIQVIGYQDYDAKLPHEG